MYTGRAIMDQIPRPQSVRFLDEAAVQRALHLDALLPSMERALIDFSAGRVLQPVRSIISIREHSGFMGLMPAVYGDIMGAKLVNFYPNNGARGLPTHLAIIALFRSETGEPLAIMDGRLITELRTAAVSAVATRLLSAPDARRLAILGSGVQARAHIRALSLVRKFDEIRIWSRNPQNAILLANEVGGVATSAEEAVRDADVIVTVTASSEPVLSGKWLKPGAMVNAVGAVGPKRRELDNDAMRGAFVVDSREAAAVESGDMLLAGASIYAELGELLAGTKPKPEAEITVFKSLGLAVEDLAAAKLVLDANPI